MKRNASSAAARATVPALTKDLTVNLPNVALIIEGGGMRTAYSAGVLVALLEAGLHFGKVYAISAGTSNAVNYLSQDAPRLKASFVDIVDDPQFGGWRSWLAGTGFFNAPYLYNTISARPKAQEPVMGFDWEAFCANPADVHIEAYDRDADCTVAWEKRDIAALPDLLMRVRASSTMPFFMPPAPIGGHLFLDGGMGSSWGIPLEAALADGYERIFIIRSRERSYRKEPVGAGAQRLLRLYFHRWPKAADRVINRWKHYNAICDKLDALENRGRALQVFPASMPISSREVHRGKLEDVFAQGLAQGRAQASAWERWLRG